ncbi:MAG: ATP-dependent sacrificial sulfur transferase LarE [Spirochaetales bacterium]|nr:ATP-dependent sacrificial sulfur transferase LarE [Spirochaetales bacterium]
MNLPETLSRKYAALLDSLKGLRRVIVAFSGGVDSTFLLYAALEALGKDNVLAVTADSRTYARRELRETEELARTYSFRHRIITTDELSTINDKGNTRQRCYYCKRELFSRLKGIAAEEGYDHVAEGSNADDKNDFRPGFKAVRELSVRSPLLEAGMRKDEIRLVSRELGLPTFNKPPVACFTSRFPYNVTIGEEDLFMIEEAEDYLHDRGFALCRVRHYGKKARIEVDRAMVPMALSLENEIRARLTGLGYTSVEIDPEGYRTGSMNENDGQEPA